MSEHTSDTLESLRDALLIPNLVHEYERLRQFDDGTDATEAEQDRIYRQILAIQKRIRAAIVKVEQAIVKREERRLHLRLR